MTDKKKKRKKKNARKGKRSLHIEKKNANVRIHNMRISLLAFGSSITVSTYEASVRTPFVLLCVGSVCALGALLEVSGLNENRRLIFPMVNTI